MTQAPEPRPAGDGRKLADYAGRKGQLPTWPRVGLLLALLAFTFFVAKSCQDNQVRVTQAQAVELAKKQVDFAPENTQIRLLRQGLDRQPDLDRLALDPRGPRTEPRQVRPPVAGPHRRDHRQGGERRDPGARRRPADRTGGEHEPRAALSGPRMRVLVLQHIACEHPGVFCEVMRERGVEAVAVEVDEGEPLPDWREFDAVLAMGGPMGAGDDADHPWLAAERRAGARGGRGRAAVPRRLPRSAAARRGARRPRL